MVKRVVIAALILAGATCAIRIGFFSAESVAPLASPVTSSTGRSGDRLALTGAEFRPEPREQIRIASAGSRASRSTTLPAMSARHFEQSELSRMSKGDRALVQKVARYASFTLSTVLRAVEDAGDLSELRRVYKSLNDPVVAIWFEAEKLRQAIQNNRMRYGPYESKRWPGSMYADEGPKPLFPGQHVMIATVGSEMRVTRINPGDSQELDLACLQLAEVERARAVGLRAWLQRRK